MNQEKNGKMAKFIYDDMMRRVGKEKMTKIKRLDLIDTLERYAHENEFYEDLIKIKEIKDVFLTSKKTKKR